MRFSAPVSIGTVLGPALALLSLGIEPGVAQQDAAPAPPHAAENKAPADSGPPPPAPPPANAPAAPQARAVPRVPGSLVEVPVTRLFPGGVSIRPAIANPVAGDPQAAIRGKRYFDALNCVGCHAPHGGGGMGPSLSNGVFIYGGEPANIFLTIVQGRPQGMPAWGGMLPDSVIWDLVTYIQNLSDEPTPQWGKTFSKEALKIEQVPAGKIDTDRPWQHTQPFSSGQKP